MESAENDKAIAYVLLRATLGLNLLGHGGSRILAGPSHFAGALVSMFHTTPLPAGLVYPFGLILPWIELLVGVLILLGFCTRWALIAGSLLMLALTFGTTLRQDWEAASIQLGYAVVFAALLAFRERNVFSLDLLLRRR